MGQVTFRTRTNENGETELCGVRYACRTDTVEIPEGVKRIKCRLGEMPAKWALKRVILPEGLLEIGDEAFFECKVLEQIVLPQSVQEIGYSAFSDCTALKEIVLPEGLEKIDTLAFNGCEALERVVLPQSLREIGNNAFSGCTALKEVVLPDGLTQLKSSTFYGCESLEKINIPEGLQDVAENAFRNCYKLPPLGLKVTQDYKKEVDGAEFTVTVKEGRVFLSAIDRKRNYGTVFLPEVQEITGEALQNSSVNCVIIADGTELIAENAFRGCVNMDRIFIPENVQTIGKDAFLRCTHAEIYCEGEPQAGWIDEPEQTVEECVEVPDGWVDYHHQKMGSHWENVKRVISNSYNPDKRPVHVNVTREEFAALCKKSPKKH